MSACLHTAHLSLSPSHPSLPACLLLLSLFSHARAAAHLTPLSHSPAVLHSTRWDKASALPTATDPTLSPLSPLSLHHQVKKLDMVGKIKREIQILKLFRHPHIIKL